MRVFALSDLHIDYPQNGAWLNQLSTADYQADSLILAGDVTDKTCLLADSFWQLARRFKNVLYVPGNHELWIIRSRENTSFDKFDIVTRLARENGLSMAPFQHESFTLVPLLGWYDFSFGEPTPWLRDHWMDFHACDWGELHHNEAAITTYFTQKNETAIRLATTNRVSHPVISFSHFLPRIDLMPDTISAANQRLYPVLGSHQIEQQIRRLQSTTHIYGHSHVNRHITLEGITYINNAFGTPHEKRITAKKLLCIYPGEACSTALT